MKIGILTFFKALNNGSLLQAKGVYDIFRHHFPEAEIEVIDYVPLGGYKKEYSLPLNPFLIGRKLRDIRLTDNFIKNHLVLSADSLRSDDFDTAMEFIREKSYDLLVVGSDTVFEAKPTHGYAPAIPNAYWLSPTIKSYKVAFAASADRSDTGILMRNKDHLATCLNDFNLLGVRDSFTFDTVRSLGLRSDKALFKIPDPTFFLPIQETEVRKKLTRLGVNNDDKLVGLHLDSKASSQIIASYYRKKGYRIIAPATNPSADINLKGQIDPLEWAEVYKYLDLMITNRFHGTVFSIKNTIPFVSVDDAQEYKHQRSKKEDMLEDCQLSGHLISHSDSQDAQKIIKKAEFIRNNFNKNQVLAAIQNRQAILNNFMDQVKKDYARFAALKNQ